jgi:hypothetical protein
LAIFRDIEASPMTTEHLTGTLNADKSLPCPTCCRHGGGNFGNSSNGNPSGVQSFGRGFPVRRRREQAHRELSHQLKHVTVRILEINAEGVLVEQERQGFVYANRREDSSVNSTGWRTMLWMTSLCLAGARRSHRPAAYRRRRGRAVPRGVQGDRALREGGDRQMGRSSSWRASRSNSL